MQPNPYQQVSNYILENKEVSLPHMQTAKPEIKKTGLQLNESLLSQQNIIAPAGSGFKPVIGPG